MSFALPQWLRRNAAAVPDAPALLLPAERLSWAALLERARTLAEPSPQPLVAAAPAERLAPLAYAAGLAGRAFFPLNPALPAATRDRLGGLVGPGGSAELIVASSGTAGAPKAAMLSPSNLRAHVAASRGRLGLEPGDLWLDCLPLFHIGGLAILWRCAEAGATVLLHAGFEAGRMAADLAAHPVTHLSLVPSMLALLLERGARPPPGLRVCLVGGAALAPELARRALAEGWPLWPTYGMSEAGSQVATLPGADAAWRAGAVGRPLSGMELRLSEGCIAVRGPAVMLGYANPQMLPGLGLDDEGWFETGDLGEDDGAGGLVVLGRADDVLVTGGENVHPLAVEAVAVRCPGATAVAVTGRPHPVWGESLVAAVVGPVEAEAFLAFCRVHLPPHMRPRAVLRLDALPLNATGKLDRKALRELARPRRETTKTQRAPRSHKGE